MQTPAEYSVRHPEFARLFRQALDDAETNPFKLSKLTGISHTAIGNYAKGFDKPRRDKLEVLAAALNKPAEYFGPVEDAPPGLRPISRATAVRQRSAKQVAAAATSYLESYGDEVQIAPGETEPQLARRLTEITLGGDIEAATNLSVNPASYVPSPALDGRYGRLVPTFCVVGSRGLELPTASVKIFGPAKWEFVLSFAFNWSRSGKGPLYLVAVCPDDPRSMRSPAPGWDRGRLEGLFVKMFEDRLIAGATFVEYSPRGVHIRGYEPPADAPGLYNYAGLLERITPPH